MEKGKLKWVQGNSLTLAIPLQKQTISGDGSIVPVDYEIPDGSTVTVTLVSMLQRIPITCSFAGNIVKLEDNGTLSPDIYGIEVMVVEPEGRKLRSMWRNQLEILFDNAGKLEEYNTFMLNDSALLDAAVFYGNDKRGYSSYEIAVQNGFVGTEEAWLESLKEPARSAAESLSKIVERVVENTNASAKSANQAANRANEATGNLEIIKRGCTDSSTLCNSAAQRATEKVAEIDSMMKNLSGEGTMSPVKMTIDYLPAISIKNKQVQRINVTLYPLYVMKNVLFQRVGGKSLSVNPSGGLTIEGTGDTSFYVIPTQNTELWQQVDIRARLPYVRLSKSGKLRLNGNKIRSV